MNKEEYLKQLENCIMALPAVEQKEALDYYRSFFDEAEDDQKAIDELGSPEKLAESIKEKFTCVPEKKENAKKSEGKSDEGFFGSGAEHGSGECERVFYSFETASVKSVTASLSAADIRFIGGTKFSLEARGVDSSAVDCSLGGDGNLRIECKPSISGCFWNHSRSVATKPRVLITIPYGAVLDSFKLRLGAANLIGRDVEFSCGMFYIDVGCANAALGSIEAKRADIRCGMGNAEISGKLGELCNIDCGMGNVKLVLKGDPKKVSIDSKVGLGSIKFNGQRKAGVMKDFAQVRLDNHFSVNCGMGNVDINVREI